MNQPPDSPVQLLLVDDDLVEVARREALGRTAGTFLEGSVPIATDAIDGTGLAELVVVDGAGHYPHTQFPDETVALLLPFLEAHARA